MSQSPIRPPELTPKEETIPSFRRASYSVHSPTGVRKNVHLGLPNLCRLLGSENPPEVLEQRIKRDVVNYRDASKISVQPTIFS